MIEIRDPLHGAITIGAAEAAILDHPFVQRLRGIKQMGFSELPFPGAVHSRYAHSLGVMELAGLAFDQLFSRGELPEEQQRCFRLLVRVAALCHDLGHAPFSHCTEFAMPPLKQLGIDAYDPELVGHRLEEKATHEDYTIAVLTRSSLARTIAWHLPFSGQHVAALISREVRSPDGLFKVGNLDYRQVLSQLISSEVDVDRLDYLARDAYYSGAAYGTVDSRWLLSNLGCRVVDGVPTLVLDHRAIHAFDHFMIARYHMFVMVYYHHKSVCYEELLRKHFNSPECRWRFPEEVEDYRDMDDVTMHAYLRSCRDEWARRICERRPFRRAIERHGTPREVGLKEAEERLLDAEIPYLHTSSVSQLSRYAGKKRRSAAPIYVQRRLPGGPEELLPLEQATLIFDRYKQEHHVARLYVPEERMADAQALLRSLPPE